MDKASLDSGLVGSQQGWFRIRAAIDQGLTRQNVEIAFTITVEHLSLLAVVLAVVATAMTGWLVTIGYRAYTRRRTRLLWFATAGLGTIAISRMIGIASGGFYAVSHDLSVPILLAVQISRSVMLVIGFGLLIYALVTRG